MANVTLSFRVTGARTEPGDIEATLDGKPVKAIADRLVIELVSADGDQGHILKLPVTSTEEFEAQRAAFAIGASVTVTVEADAKRLMLADGSAQADAERV